jgi:membrane protein DedA with SNARE-associated domain
VTEAPEEQPRPRRRWWVKPLGMVAAIAIIPVLMWWYQPQLVRFAQTTPGLATIYEASTRACTEAELSPGKDARQSCTRVDRKSWVGLCALIALGSLFFVLFLPKYAVYLLFYAAAAPVGELLAHPPALRIAVLVPMAIFGLLAAMVINYGVGRSIGRLFFRYLAKEQFAKMSALLERFGVPLIVGGYLLPGIFPHALLALVAGAVSFPFRTFVYATLAGGVIFFGGLSLLYPVIAPWIPELPL